MEANGRRTGDHVESYGWRTKDAGTIEKGLFAEGHAFDFFQAVRLLEMIQAGDGLETAAPEVSGQQALPRRVQASPAEGADPSKEVVRFRSAVTLDFPASDIESLNSGNGDSDPAGMVAHFKTREMPAEMTVNFLGLAGGLGALDIPTTELVLQQASRKDQPLKDFLDIFNHRLVSLLYRIRKHHRVGLGVATPGEDQISRYLYSLIGLGTPNLQGRMHFRDRSLLYYAGILAQQPRSMVGLERILADYFKVQVKGHQFKGEWSELEASQWSTIGDSGRNQRLGRDTVIVGTRVWDQHARFEIQLGPLTLRQFLGFLPTNWRFGALCDLIRFYVKDQFEFSVRLTLCETEIVGSRLDSFDAGQEGEEEAPSLGLLAWTSRLNPWLPRFEVRKWSKTRGDTWRAVGEESSRKDETMKSSHDNAENFSITISPESLRSGGESIKSRILYRLPVGRQSEMLAMTHQRSERRSSVVMLQGKPGNSMFVIRSGRVQISRRREDGKEQVVSILGEGDSFGERALLLNKPYSETALTLTDCKLSEISQEDLKKIVKRYPILQRTIDAYISDDALGQGMQVAI
ncbi:MAG: type secretion system protein ImpH [Blastocatellia bacterium]|nr:type secretion system protein ImpH [Blastocatellia bacterium]